MTEPCIVGLESSSSTGTSQQTETSWTSTASLTPNSRGRNMDDFFHQPSPHELSVVDHLYYISEIRISNIIADLQRLVDEELERWSFSSVNQQNKPTDSAPTPTCSEPANLCNHNSKTVSRRKSQTLSVPGTKPVSSPLSFLSPCSSPFSKHRSSNMSTVVSSKLSLHRPRPHRHNDSSLRPQSRRTYEARGTISALCSQSIPSEVHKNETPKSPTKPSFQSFLKRVPKDSSQPQAQSQRPDVLEPNDPAYQTGLIDIKLGDRFHSCQHGVLSEVDQMNTKSSFASKSITKRKPLPSDSRWRVPFDTCPALAEGIVSIS